MRHCSAPCYQSVICRKHSRQLSDALTALRGLQRKIPDPLCLEMLLLFFWIRSSRHPSTPSIYVSPSHVKPCVVMASVAYKSGFSDICMPSWIKSLLYVPAVTEVVSCFLAGFKYQTQCLLCRSIVQVVQVLHPISSIHHEGVSIRPVS